MTRSISVNNYAALQQRLLVARDFIWFVVRDRASGAPVYDGYWSDAGPITAAVVDPDTGGTSTRTWFGAGTLISISDIPLVSSITVQTVEVHLSQVADRVNDLIRTYDCKQGRVEVYRGLFNTDTRMLVDPATPRFVGFIDHIEVKTPKENEEGGVTLSCTSHTQEMTRSNPDTRSDSSQRLRRATDSFLQDAAVVGDWQHFWGRASGSVSTSGVAEVVAAKSAALS